MKQCETRNQFYYLHTNNFILGCVLHVVTVYWLYWFCTFAIETFIKAIYCLGPFWPFDHVLNIIVVFGNARLFWYIWYQNEVWHDMIYGMMCGWLNESWLVLVMVAKKNIEWKQSLTEEIIWNIYFGHKYERKFKL